MKKRPVVFSKGGRNDFHTFPRPDIYYHFYLKKPSNMNIPSKYFCILFFILLSCRNPIVYERGEIIDLRPDNKEELSFYSIIDSVYYISLETLPGSILANMSRFRYSEGKIVVINAFSSTFEVVVFDNSGKYLYRNSKMGRGPDEYIAVNCADIHPHNGNLVIVDGSTRRILEYSPESILISSIKVGAVINSIQFLESNSSIQYIVSTGERLFDPGSAFSLFRINEGGEIIEKIMPFEYVSRITSGSSERLNRISDSLISFNREFSNDLIHITQEKIINKYYLDFPKPILPAEKSNMDFISNDNPKMADYVFNIILRESKDFIYCRYLWDWKGYPIIYEKSTKQSFLINLSRVKGCTTCAPIISNEVLVDDQILFPVEAKDLIPVITAFKKNGFDYLTFPNDNWNESNNPSIFFVKLKSNLNNTK